MRNFCSRWCEARERRRCFIVLRSLSNSRSYDAPSRVLTEMVMALGLLFFRKILKMLNALSLLRSRLASGREIPPSEVITQLFEDPSIEKLPWCRRINRKAQLPCIERWA